MRSSILPLLLLLSLARPLPAQVAPAPDAPPTTPSPAFPSPATPAAPSSPAPPVHSPPAFQVSANLVDLSLIVHGPHGKPVPNLGATDCSVFEDNEKQTLTGFSAHSDRPLTLGLLLDTSLSQQRVLPIEQEAGAAFLRRVLQPHDEAFLLSFDVDVTQLADFTASPRDLKRALDQASINSSSGNFATGTIPAIGKPKGTLLYDAVYLAATEKLRPEAGRKALVLLTDGEDQGSRESLKSAIQAAQKANAIVYVLLIQDSGIDEMLAASGEGPMKNLAAATGGKVFKIGSNGRKMQAAFEQIESELRSQYQAVYTPTNHARDGTYRRIRVQCRQNGQPLHVQVRQGYYAESPVLDQQ